MEELKKLVDRDVEAVQISIEDCTGLEVVRFKKNGTWTDPQLLSKVLFDGNKNYKTIKLDQNKVRNTAIYLLTSFLIGVASGYAWRMIQLM